MTTHEAGTPETQIRALIAERATAVRAKDVDGALSHIAPDILSFDVINRLQHVGSDAIRQRADEWFSTFEGPIGYEIRDLSVTASDDVAFSHSLFRVSGTLSNGGTVGMWVRSTICYRKIDGGWTITHEHSSVPFDVETGQASLNLNP